MKTRPGNPLSYARPETPRREPPTRVVMAALFFATTAWAVDFTMNCSGMLAFVPAVFVAVAGGVTPLAGLTLGLIGAARRDRGALPAIVFNLAAVVLLAVLALWERPEWRI